MAFSITTLSIMALRLMTFSITTLSLMALRIMTIGITTLALMTLNITIKTCDITQHITMLSFAIKSIILGDVMLSVVKINVVAPPIAITSK